MLHWEDLTPGRIFELGTVTFDRDEIVGFATLWDPQRFHLDVDGAQSAGLPDVIASGWHTVCASMRLLVDGLVSGAANLPGPGVEEIRWPAPVLPGDLLTATFEILSSRLSASRPDRGIVQGLLRTVNQDGTDVMTLRSTMFVLRA